MKNVNIRTKLLTGFLMIDALILFVIYTSNSTVGKIVGVENPERYMRNYRIFSVVSLLIAMTIMTYMTVVLTRTIRKSIEQLLEISAQVADGKVDVHIEKMRNDEFGKLVDEYQRVVDNVRYQAMIAEQVAEGNLTVEVTPRSEEDLLGNSLKKLVNRNHHALTNINDSAYQVMISSSQVASASEALAQGSTEQASAIEQITASISDIADKTKQNAAEANEAAELVGEAIGHVKKGNEQMQDMMVAMDDINKSSESISKIIKVIDDIAFQTNILALNAAVEAARAGEAGKGFAVVAEEVRNLAAKSAAAASETAELIEDSIHKVEAGSQIADDTAKALEAITGAVQKTEAMITDIAEASNYQATAIAQINQAVEQVSQVVQTNSATSEECAAASEELSNQANRMRNLLSVYHLGDTAVQSESTSEEEIRFDDTANRSEDVISLNEGFGKY